MGSKRTGKRKHLFLCLACSIVISLVMDGCVYLHVQKEGEEDLARARSLMSQGAFEASLRKSQEVLRRYPQSQGDHALFQMGLIYANPQNPKADYRKSLFYFERLKREFPSSDLRSDAEIWILVLQKISEKDKDIEILRKIWNQKAKELAEKQEDVNKLRNQVESLQNQTKSLQSQTGQLDEQIKDLQKQIKQLKEIDLGIEEKKRDALKK
jgi:tetratricopeptide (TPR) repeat protein